MASSSVSPRPACATGLSDHEVAEESAMGTIAGASSPLPGFSLQARVRGPASAVSVTSKADESQEPEPKADEIHEPVPQENGVVLQVVVERVQEDVVDEWKKQAARNFTKRKAFGAAMVAVVVLSAAAAATYASLPQSPADELSTTESVLHVSGHSANDRETSALIAEMHNGKESFELVISDDAQNLTWGHFSMNVTRFASRLPNITNMSFKAAVIINEDDDGILVGSHRFRAIACDQQGPIRTNCEFVEKLPAVSGRGLADDGDIGDNEMIVYLTGIAVLGALAVTCIFACTGAVAVAAGGVSLTAGAGCFPSSAVVNALGGAQTIKSAAVGTLLLTSQGYAPVFLNSHQNGAALSQMVRLMTASNHSLILTADHYLPLGTGYYTSAGRVTVGDEVMVQSGDGFAPSAVTSVSSVWEEGLWNPFTITGDLVVNGVLASSHSSWFLEGTSQLSEDSIVHVYKALLGPMGALYRLAPAWFARFAAAFKNDHRALSEVGAVEILSTAGQTLLQM